MKKHPMIRLLLFLTIGLLFYSQSFAQIVREHELVRLGFGVSTMIDREINSLIEDVEKLSDQIGPELNVTRFKSHITFFIEYENEFSEQWSYLARFQYHSDVATGSSYDQDSKIEQGMNYELTLYETGLELLYYIPFIKIGGSETRIIAGAGPTLAYSEVGSYYFYDQRPAYLQVIETERNNIVFGARIFSGLDIPFVESLDFHLRFGISIYIEKKLPGEVNNEAFDESGKTDGAMNPQIFVNNNMFDFSQAWVTFNIGYRF